MSKAQGQLCPPFQFKGGEINKQKSVRGIGLQRLKSFCAFWNLLCIITEALKIHKSTNFHCNFSLCTYEILLIHTTL